MHGRAVKPPRWQQAYGADYRYTGNTNRALPVPDELAPLVVVVEDDGRGVDHDGPCRSNDRLDEFHLLLTRYRQV